MGLLHGDVSRTRLHPKYEAKNGKLLSLHCVMSHPTFTHTHSRQLSAAQARGHGRIPLGDQLL